MIKLQQNQALTSHFESFLSIVKCLSWFHSLTIKMCFYFTSGRVHFAFIASQYWRPASSLKMIFASLPHHVWTPTEHLAGSGIWGQVSSIKNSCSNGIWRGEVQLSKRMPKPSLQNSHLQSGSWKYWVWKLLMGINCQKFIPFRSRQLRHR